MGNCSSKKSTVRTVVNSNSQSQAGFHYNKKDRKVEYWDDSSYGNVSTGAATHTTDGNSSQEHGNRSRNIKKEDPKSLLGEIAEYLYDDMSTQPSLEYNPKNSPAVSVRSNKRGMIPSPKKNISVGGPEPSMSPLPFEPESVEVLLTFNSDSQRELAIEREIKPIASTESTENESTSSSESNEMKPLLQNDCNDDVEERISLFKEKEQAEAKKPVLSSEPTGVDGITEIQVNDFDTVSQVSGTKMSMGPTEREDDESTVLHGAALLHIDDMSIRTDTLSYDGSGKMMYPIPMSTVPEQQVNKLLEAPTQDIHSQASSGSKSTSTSTVSFTDFRGTEVTASNPSKPNHSTDEFLENKFQDLSNYHNTNKGVSKLPASIYPTITAETDEETMPLSSTETMSCDSKDSPSSAAEKSKDSLSIGSIDSKDFPTAWSNIENVLPGEGTGKTFSQVESTKKPQQTSSNMDTIDAEKYSEESVSKLQSNELEKSMEISSVMALSDTINDQSFDTIMEPEQTMKLSKSMKEPGVLELSVTVKTPEDVNNASMTQVKVAGKNKRSEMVEKNDISKNNDIPSISSTKAPNTKSKPQGKSPIRDTKRTSGMSSPPIVRQTKTSLGRRKSSIPTTISPVRTPPRSCGTPPKQTPSPSHSTKRVNLLNSSKRVGSGSRRSLVPTLNSPSPNSKITRQSPRSNTSIQTASSSKSNLESNAGDTVFSITPTSLPWDEKDISSMTKTKNRDLSPASSVQSMQSNRSTFSSRSNCSTFSSPDFVEGRRAALQRISKYKSEEKKNWSAARKCKECGKWEPNLYPSKKGCDRCYYLASEKEKEVYVREGSHHCIALTSGGCPSRKCQHFNLTIHPDGVRLCRICFNAVHRPGNTLRNDACRALEYNTPTVEK